MYILGILNILNFGLWFSRSQLFSTKTVGGIKNESYSFLIIIIVQPTHLVSKLLDVVGVPPQLLLVSYTWD